MVHCLLTERVHCLNVLVYIQCICTKGRNGKKTVKKVCVKNCQLDTESSVKWYSQI